MGPYPSLLFCHCAAAHMSTETQSENDHRRSVGPDLIIPVAAIAFTLYYFWSIKDSPWTAQVSAFFIGAILLALCVGFLVRTGVRVARGEAYLGLGGFVSRADITSGRVAVLALTILYIVVIPWGGFTLTTFGFLFAAMAVLNRGRNLGRCALVSLALVLAGYLLFIVAFHTRFPHGPFEHLMEALF